ncbi:MAG TPA: TetR/AcrR family transcriptional regulator [Acidimicrobiia bacterium]|nr:TetR/AcrR family transcriptional regulator [Acidimicrobiia bacterium]
MSPPATSKVRPRRPTLPRTGRPRDPDLSDAILEATVAVLSESGYAALSYEAVAQRAGVHRPAIYRRWPTKGDLVAAAVESVTVALVDPATGNVRDDLVELVRQVAGLFQRNPRVRLAVRLLADLAADREVVARVNARMVSPWRDLVRTLVERGVERGELQPGLDPEIVADLVFGPLDRRILAGRAQPNRAGAERLVDTLLDGLRPRTADRPRRPRGGPRA